MYPTVKRPQIRPQRDQPADANETARQSPLFRKKEREYNRALAQLSHTRPDLSPEQRAEYALRMIFPDQFPENRAPRRQKQ